MKKFGRLLFLGLAILAGCATFGKESKNTVYPDANGNFHRLKDTVSVTEKHKKKSKKGIDSNKPIAKLLKEGLNSMYAQKVTPKK